MELIVIHIQWQTILPLHCVIPACLICISHPHYSCCYVSGSSGFWAVNIKNLAVKTWNTPCMWHLEDNVAITVHEDWGGWKEGYGNQERGEELERDIWYSKERGSQDQLCSCVSAQFVVHKSGTLPWWTGGQDYGNLPKFTLCHNSAQHYPLFKLSHESRQ